MLDEKDKWDEFYLDVKFIENIVKGDVLSMYQFFKYGDFEMYILVFGFFVVEVIQVGLDWMKVVFFVFVKKKMIEVL